MFTPELLLPGHTDEKSIEIGSVNIHHLKLRIPAFSQNALLLLVYSTEVRRGEYLELGVFLCNTPLFSRYENINIVW